MARRVNYLQWLLTVICWDGLLPLVTAVLPLVVKLIAPNNRGAIELMAIILPVVFFLFRMTVGFKRIRDHQVPEALRVLQYALFFTALFLLALIDALLVLIQIMPAGAFNQQDQLIAAAMFCIYLVAMTIAFYPGPTEEASIGYREQSA